MEQRRTAVILAIIILPAILFTLCLVLSTSVLRPGTGRLQQAEAMDIFNLFSENCSGGQFAVYKDVNMTGTPRCEPPRACASDTDCSYLDIHLLPTRVGACEKGVCVAACGSGIARPCR